MTAKHGLIYGEQQQIFVTKYCIEASACRDFIKRGKARDSGVHKVVGFDDDAFGFCENLQTTRNDLAFCALYIQLNNEWPGVRDRCIAMEFPRLPPRGQPKSPRWRSSVQARDHVTIGQLVWA
jgi:hypothetical protein